MFKFLSTFFILLSTTNLLAASTYRGGAEILNPEAYAVSAAASVFQTASYFDQDGNDLEMAAESDFQMMNLDLNLAYGISRNLEITGLAKFRNISSTINTEETTKSGIESLGVLAKYAFVPINKIQYALGVRFRQTLYTNAEYTTAAAIPLSELVLGDSGSEYGVDLYATFNQSPYKVDFMIGYNSPPNELSDEIIFKIEGGYRFLKMYALLGVEGIKSLNQDEFAETPSLKPIQAIGASRQFNTINREMMAPYIGATYSFEKFLLGLKGQTIMSGKSYDKGNQFVVFLNWNSEGVTKESVKVESFKEYQVDGSVLKVSARGNFLKIDQGLSTDVEKGMKFDIYQTDYFGGNVLVASGLVYELGADWSVIKLVKRYNDIEIKPGFAARGY